MYETIIIGGGITGLTAAIYAARKKMSYKIFTTEFGGQFMISGEILNYPGVVSSTGIDMAAIFEKQAEFNNVKVDYETVQGVEKKDDGTFLVKTDKGEYETITVIIATGSTPRKLNVPGEEGFSKKGVTYCSICDGPLFSGQKVIIVGGGSSALEAVDFVKDIASEIKLFVRGDKLEGHEYLIENVKGLDNVDIMYNTSITEIVGEKFVKGVKYTQDGQEKEMNTNGVIIEIGRIPNTDQFADLVKLDVHRHIDIDCSGHTSVPGVFAAGDVASGHEYQYIIAAGQGCMALLKAARYVANKKK